MIRVPARVCALVVFLALCLSSALAAQARRSKPPAKRLEAQLAVGKFTLVLRQVAGI